MDRTNEWKSLSGSVVLAENGIAKAVILIPEKPCAVVRYAAQELKSHLERMTGADFKITSEEPENGNAICLGNSGKEKLNLNGIARDGYRIKVKDNRIHIAGNDDTTGKSEILFRYFHPENRVTNSQKDWGIPLWDFDRGTLYGTYRFLEHLGVRWFLPGDEVGTVIPEEKNLQVSAFECKEEPVFAQRLISNIWKTPVVRNAPVPTEEYRKSYDALHWSGPKVQQWRLRMRCSTDHYPLNHHPPCLQFEERFGKTHPEYFALVKGKRSISSEMGGKRAGALCYGNPKVLQEVLKDTEAFFSGVHAKQRGLSWTDTAAYAMCYNNGWPVASNYKNMISLLPHDLYHPCDCAVCAPQISNRYGGELSDIVWGFINKASLEIQKKWPDKLVSNLAYSSYAHLPYHLYHLPDNVIIGILPCFDKLNEPYILINPERNRQYYEFTKQWQNMNGMPVAFWTHWLYRGFAPREHFGVPMMLPHFMVKNAADQGKYGRIAFMEIDTDNYLFEHLNQYFFYHAYFNPGIDADVMLKDYAEKFYGPASAEMLSIFLDIEKRCENIASANAPMNDIWSRSDMFSEFVVSGYRAKIKEALQKTENTIYGQRVLLISEYFIGQMEKGLHLYQQSGSSLKLRKTLLEEMNGRKNADLSSGKELFFQLMPLSGYPDFQPGNVQLAVKNNVLAIRLVANESALSKIKRDSRENFKNVYFDDCFEFMLVPPESIRYYQIIVNANGNYQIMHCGAGKDNLIPVKQFRMTSNANIAQEAGNWYVDLEIPLDQFAKTDLKKLWRFNIFRNRRVDHSTKYQASGIFLKEFNFHKQEQYLTLKLQ